HALSVIAEPFGNLCCHAVDSLALFARVELGEYSPALWRFQGIVAKHVALGRAVANQRDGVVAGRKLIPGDLTCRAGACDRVARVARIGPAHELREARVERRDLEMHAPLGQIRRQLPEWCRHAVPDRLRLDLDEISRPVMPIVVSIRSQGHCDRAGTKSLGALDGDESVVVGGERAAGPEPRVPQLAGPQHGRAASSELSLRRNALRGAPLRSIHWMPSSLARPDS